MLETDLTLAAEIMASSSYVMVNRISRHVVRATGHVALAANVASSLGMNIGIPGMHGGRRGKCPTSTG